jgi:hypothetical protein
MFVFCDTSDAPLDDVVAVSELVIQECTVRCLNTILMSTDAESVRIQHFDAPVVDVGRMMGHTRLARLHVIAPLVRGLEHLGGAPLVRLQVGNVTLDETFRGLLDCRKRELAELGVENDRPFGPDSLGDISGFSALVRVRVPGYQEYRRAWIDFAVSHPNVGFQFVPVKKWGRAVPRVHIAEIHRGAEIFCVQRGGELSYEISGNFAGDLLGSAEVSNHDLGDFLEPAARKAGRAVEVDTSADELIVRSSQIETCRWCVDQILASFGRGRTR